MRYSISEIDNVSVAAVPTESKRPKRGSLIRNSKNNLALTTQVIPESQESQDEDKTILNNGHHADCNINRHLRYEQENSSGQSKFPAGRVISVIEEASV